MTAVAKRQKVERSIARRLILDGLSMGYTIGVHNGEELVLNRSAKSKDILAAMFSVDEEKLYFYKDGWPCGWVFLVYGNDGWDVICDYTVNLEPIMAGAHTLSEKILERLSL